jgi:hypothetical protein
MANTVVTLEDRLGQLTTAASKAKALMTESFTHFFPGEVLPTGTFELVEYFFRPGGKADAFARDKLQAGAAVALALVKAHHPDADVDAIAEGIPVDAQGEPVDVEALLPVVKPAAELVVDLVEGSAPATEEEQQSNV